MITINELLADHQGGHSDLQMDSFITVRSGGTAYGCYKQALRELSSRVDSLRSLYVDRALDKVEIAEREAAAETDNEFKRQRRRIKLAAKRLGLQSLNRKIEAVEREFLHFYGQAATLKGMLGELTPERRHMLDCEMWTHNLRCKAAVDLATSNNLSASTMEILHSLPADMRRSIVNGLADRAALVEWYFSEASEFKLPDVLALPAIDIPLLVQVVDG